MTAQELIDTAPILVATGKDLVAMGESNTSCDKRFRFASWGIPQTQEAGHAYCELLITTLRFSECISALILYDETIREQKSDGTSLAVQRSVNGHRLQLPAQVRSSDD